MKAQIEAAGWTYTSTIKQRGFSWTAKATCTKGKCTLTTEAYAKTPEDARKAVKRQVVAALGLMVELRPNEEVLTPESAARMERLFREHRWRESRPVVLDVGRMAKRRGDE